MNYETINSEDHLLMYEIWEYPDKHSRANQRAEAIHARLKAMWDDYNTRRGDKVTRILRSWAQYFGTPESQEYLRREALGNDIGKVRKDWRHKIATGKAFEMVEYAVAYLMRATFPNEMWFDMLPLAPGLDPEVDWRMQVKLLTTFMRMKLDEAKFKEQWNIFLRQLCISGTSIMTCPWLLELKKTKKNVKVRTLVGDEIEVHEVEKVIYNAPQIKVEDVLDFALDPDSKDPGTANLFRKMIMSKGDVLRLVKSGVYNMATEKDVKEEIPHTRNSSLYDNTAQVQEFLGITKAFHPNDTLEVFEFWGDVQCGGYEIKDVVITYTKGHILRMETNPYWGGRPFIIGTLLPVPGSVYGISMLEPVGGMLAGLDIIFNQRLDGNEVTLNPMMGFLNDGTDTNDMYFEPGKIIPLNTQQSLFPIFQNLNINSVSVQEEQIIEEKIDRVMGTGAYIGSGASRDAERVTAVEVNATRESGGVRLSEIYRHIESTVLLLFLQRTFEYIRQFTVTDQLVPLQGRSVDEIIYAYVGVEELSVDYQLRPLGASHVVDQETELRQLMDWVGFVGSSEQMVGLVNWLEVLKEATRRFIGGDVDRFIQEAPAQPAMPPEMAGMIDPALQQQQQVMDSAQQMGGAELQNALAGHMAVDGGQARMQQEAQSIEPLMAAG